AVHRTRVASRRLREMLPVLGLDSAATPKLGRRLKKGTNRLGEVRELDVFTLMIQELSDDPPHSSTALKQVGTAGPTHRPKGPPPASLPESRSRRSGDSPAISAARSGSMKRTANGRVCSGAHQDRRTRGCGRWTRASLAARWVFAPRSRPPAACTFSSVFTMSAWR